MTKRTSAEAVSNAPQMLCLIPLLNTLCTCKNLCKPCHHLWDPRQDVPLLCIPWVYFPSTKASFYFILGKYKHGFDLFIQSNLPSPLKVPWKCQKCSFKVLDPNQDHTLLVPLFFSGTFSQNPPLHLSWSSRVLEIFKSSYDCSRSNEWAGCGLKQRCPPSLPGT